MKSLQYLKPLGLKSAKLLNNLEEVLPCVNNIDDIFEFHGFDRPVFCNSKF